MVDLKAKIEPIRDAATGQFVSNRAFKSLFHAAATIARDAKRSITKSLQPSKPGRPPHTRRNLLKRSIRYAGEQSRKTIVVGPLLSVVGGSAEAHEHGGSYKGDKYPARPFMQPALQRNLHRLGGEYTGTIGG